MPGDVAMHDHSPNGASARECSVAASTHGSVSGEKETSGKKRGRQPRDSGGDKEKISMKGAPKPPMHAKEFFTQDREEAMTGLISQKFDLAGEHIPAPVVKQAALREWEFLTRAEKKIYEDKAKPGWDKYKEDMQAWFDAKALKLRQTVAENKPFPKADAMKILGTLKGKTIGPKEVECAYIEVDKKGDITVSLQLAGPSRATFTDAMMKKEATDMTQKLLGVEDSRWSRVVEVKMQGKNGITFRVPPPDTCRTLPQAAAILKKEKQAQEEEIRRKEEEKMMKKLIAKENEDERKARIEAEAEELRREQEKARREAEKEAERARKEAEKAQKEAERQAERERKEAERLRKEAERARKEAEREAEMERERQEREAEKERLRKEREAERERLAKEKEAERVRKEKERQEREERIAKEKEEERLRKEKERQEREAQKERERLQREAEKERERQEREAEKERERKEKEEERLRKEAEKERLRKEKEEEQLRKEKERQEREAQKEAERVRIAKEKEEERLRKEAEKEAERQRIAKEKEEAERAKAEALRKLAEAKQSVVSSLQMETMGGSAVVQNLGQDKGSQIQVTFSKSKDSFDTVASTSLEIPAGCKAFYEVIVSVPDQGAEVQFGWAQKGFSTDGGNGVGDDAHSWGLCGLRKKKFHNGKDSKFGEHQWYRGDAVGIAIDTVTNKGTANIMFGLNGIWKKPMGVAFDFVPCGKNGAFYPALSGAAPMKCHVNMGAGKWKYGPPDASFSSVVDVVAAQKVKQ